MLYTGDEHIVLNGHQLPYTMIDFWRFSLSEILLNMTRGGFAEFLVRCALQDNGFDSIRDSKTGIEPYDIDGPTIQIKDIKRRSHIEVKSAASIQINTPDEKEPLSLPDSQLKFSIKSSIDWEQEAIGANRNNDLYVFAHYTAQYKSNNMLDMKFWDFYVCPTYKIDNDSFLKDKNSVSLWRLKEMGLCKCSYETLFVGLTEALSEIENYYNGEESRG